MIILLHAFLKKVGEHFSLRKALSFWYRHNKILFFSCFFIVLLIGAWSWYYSLYQYRLSDEEKRQYIERNFRETIFKEGEFREVVDMLADRIRKAETFEVQRDIFQGKGVQEKE